MESMFPAFFHFLRKKKMSPSGWIAGFDDTETLQNTLGNKDVLDVEKHLSESGSSK